MCLEDVIGAEGEKENLVRNQVGEIGFGPTKEIGFYSEDHRRTIWGFRERSDLMSQILKGDSLDYFVEYMRVGLRQEASEWKLGLRTSCQENFLID